MLGTSSKYPANRRRLTIEPRNYGTDISPTEDISNIDIPVKYKVHSMFMEGWVRNVRTKKSPAD